jgi:two-component system cell cycle sensor histidine kinase/response regulator CckA
LGYQVLTAASPGEAIHTAREHAGRIHLLITDVIMPEMNGLALAERLRTVRPDITVLFMSGYADDVLGQVLDPSVHFIHKPFLQETLLKELREVLAGEAHQRP